MGINTTVVILNDALNEIENDPDFGKNLGDAIRKHGFMSSPTTSVSSGGFCDAAEVIEMHHSECRAIIEVGGSMGVKLFDDVGKIKYSKERTLNIVKEMAKQLGYRLVKRA